jgi:hypothetical protein
LDFEIGGSKQCLASHGYTSTLFAYPYNEGSNNPIVVTTVAKYYDMARSGAAPLMFLVAIASSSILKLIVELILLTVMQIDMLSKVCLLTKSK